MKYPYVRVLCTSLLLLSLFFLPIARAEQQSATARPGTLQEATEGTEQAEAPSPTQTAILIHIGDETLHALLDDSQTTRDFLGTLPQTVALSRLADREYYGGIEGEVSITEQGQKTYEPGDVGYWIRGEGIALFFGSGKPLSSPIIKMGTMTDCTYLENLGEAIEVTIEVAE